MAQTVVILGAAYAGLNVAHKLLKHTVPNSPGLKVILVNPSPKFYWNMASVRAIVPGQIPDAQLFHNIEPNFAYAGDKFEFVLGSAENVNVQANSVEVKTPSGVRTLTYDQLVVATGSRGDLNMPWKSAGSLEQTLDELHATQKRVAEAKSIVVCGGGATGTETAAELGFEYGSKKEITIITSAPTILHGNMTEPINLGAEKELEKLKVKIVRKTRVSSTRQLETGQTELTLSTGTLLVCDLYLPTTGLHPNTSFLPSSFLNSKGEINVTESLLAKGTKNVWAIGDCSALQRSGYMITEAQAGHLFKSLDAVLKGQKANVKAYKVPEKDMMAVSLGRSRGTGYGMGFKLPSFLVYYAKGKTLGVQNGPKLVAGTGL